MQQSRKERLGVVGAIQIVLGVAVIIGVASGFPAGMAVVLHVAVVGGTLGWASINARKREGK